MKRRAWIFVGAILVALVLAAQASACPVCYGESDDQIVRGAEASVIFMVGVTYLLLTSGVGVFFLLRRRARKAMGQTATSQTATSHRAMPIQNPS